MPYTELREAAQQALEALENAGEAVYAHGGIAAVGSLNSAAQNLRAALMSVPDGAEPQEPVAFCAPSEPNARHAFSWPGIDRQHSHTAPLYTAPQPRRRLTLEEIDRALDIAGVPELPAGYESVEIAIARAVEAAVWGEAK
jgi:hypothetical protein